MAYGNQGAGAPFIAQRSRLFGLFFAVPMVLVFVSPPPAAAQNSRTAALPRPDTAITRDSLPTILAAEDAFRYRRIFALQRDGSWGDADHEISLLKDRLLMGEVLAQRYLHHGYQASYGDLSEWLRRFGDLPEASAVYALALKHRPAGAPEPARPTDAHSTLRFGELDQLVLGYTEDGEPFDERLADPFAAASRSRLPVGPLQFRQGNARVEGRPFEFTAIQESGHGGPGWEAGLAAWRRGRYAEACQFFERAARTAGASPGQVAAAAFWAARSELRDHHPEQVDAWLDMAAAHPHTFYGLLARRTLGVDIYFNFDFGPLSEAHGKLLREVLPGRRALALIQVGEIDAAEAVLRQMAAHGDPPALRAVEALADRAGMPALSFQLAALLARSDDSARDRAMFPIPRWTPLGGFKVDRALLFALMRQESQFQLGLRSRSGAIGPMQIMPATARSMAKRLGLSETQRQDLAAPAVNLALAQEYIAQLEADDHIGNNLLVLAAAYNSGPGPVHQWLASDAVRRDPLLFLESIPNRETRGFAERVLTNYWVYRLRLGQPTPDLDTLAAGQWPTYTAMDGSGGIGASYAKN